MSVGLIELGGGRLGGFRFVVAGFRWVGSSRCYQLTLFGDGVGTKIKCCKIRCFLPCMLKDSFTESLEIPCQSITSHCRKPHSFIDAHHRSC